MANRENKDRKIRHIRLNAFDVKIEESVGWMIPAF